MAFRQLAKRVGAGAVLIPIVLYLTYRGGLAFAIFVSAIAAIGAWEFQKMARARGLAISPAVLVPGSGVVAITFYFGSPAAQVIVFTVVALLALMERLARMDVADYMLSVSLTLAGVIYVGWLLGFYILLREFPVDVPTPAYAGAGDMGRSFVFLVLILAWCSDSAAYFVGSAIGKHSLMSRVSPSKTVEGTVSGVVCSVGAALVARATFAAFLGLGQALTIGVIIGVSCVVGDLVESMLKRSTGVKDSSNLIPGHGGMLDRFDSLLFAGPVLYLYAKLAF
jgi:phosphatidate cytidylyltransferase